LVTCRAPDNGPNRVIVSNGIVKSLQDYQPDAFTTPIAIGSSIECEAFAIFAEKA
jgi:hypothetical protein